jgi:hypothetical protein
VTIFDGLQEGQKERLRILFCDFCCLYTKFDAGIGWFHCSVCKKCYTCLKTRVNKCTECTNWDKQDKVMEKKDRVRIKQEESKTKDLTIAVEE